MSQLSIDHALIGAVREINGGNDSEFDQEIRYSNLTAGADPRDDPGIPARGNSRLFGADVYFAADRSLEQFSETTGAVIVRWSTVFNSSRYDPSFKPTTISYKKVEQKLPRFVRDFYLVESNGALMSRWRWLPQPIILPVERPVLQIQVKRRYDTSLGEGIGQAMNAGTADDFLQASSQIGHLHILPGFGALRWVMQTPVINVVSASDVVINYSWEADPGNGAVAGSSMSTAVPRRPPWYGFRVEPATTESAQPEVIPEDLYPPSVNGLPNEYYTPNGYLALPGGPFG